jgi:hypothetical protein
LACFATGSQLGKVTEKLGKVRKFNGVTDLISAVLELLGRDMSRLVVEARETLEPVELWDEG